MSDLFRNLAAPFPADRVSWRVGPTNKDKTKGMALAYVDARDVMDRLDAVCTPAGWQNRYSHADGKTVCEIGILFAGVNASLSAPPIREWIWKADGAGDSEMEAEKGALSDAFKRAAVRWGIGRYLYDVSSPWVAIEPHGKSYSIPDHELARLRKMLSNSVPQTATANAVAEPTPPAPRPATGNGHVKEREPTDDDVIAADLKTMLAGARTMAAYEALIQGEEFNSQYQALPTMQRDAVFAAAGLRKRELAKAHP